MGAFILAVAEQTGASDTAGQETAEIGEHKIHRKPVSSAEDTAEWVKQIDVG